MFRNFSVKISLLDVIKKISSDNLSVYVYTPYNFFGAQVIF